MIIDVYLDGKPQQQVIEANTQLNYIKRVQGNQFVTERGRVEITIRRRITDILEGDTHIMEDTI